MLKLPILLTTLLLTSWLAARAESCLMLDLRDGTTHSYVLSQQPSVTFSDGALIMHAAEAEATFALADVDKFYFADQQSALPALRADERRFTFVDGVIRVEGQHGGVVLTDAAGHLLAAAPASADGGPAVQPFTFDLTTQPAGAYVLRIGQQAVKLYHTR